MLEHNWSSYLLLGLQCRKLRLGGRVVMQRIANPSTPVRFRPLASKNLAQVVELVDTQDLKSCALLGVPVQVRPWAPLLY